MKMTMTTDLDAISNCLGAGEKTAVHRINNWLSTDLPTTKESAVQSLNGIFASLNTVEFQIDVSLCVRIKSDVNHMTVFVLAFGSDVILKLFDPAFTLFSGS